MELFKNIKKTKTELSPCEEGVLSAAPRSGQALPICLVFLVHQEWRERLLGGTAPLSPSSPSHWSRDWPCTEASPQGLGSLTPLSLDVTPGGQQGHRPGRCSHSTAD